MKIAALRLMAVLCAALACQAFQFRAGIQGTVTDPQGAAVPEAAVSLTSQETGVSHKTLATGDGVFTISGLAPGRYSLTVEKVGFTKKVLTDVLVRAEQMQSLGVQLEVGQTTESVSVTGTVTSLIDTETAMIGGTLTATEVEKLPSFGRDPYQLVRLAPGVFGDAALAPDGSAAMMPGSNIGAPGATDSIFKVENGVQIIANGTRQNSNNFQVDGVAVNSTSWGGAAVITPNEESVKEVRVVANNYSAENGRNSGAQVMVVSQNGTNDFHGSAFFKWHRPGLNAYQRWNGPGSPSPVLRDENRFNQYGGSVGGPILKNKLFAFFSYETLRNDSQTVANNWYESAEFLQNAGPPNSVARSLLGFPGEAPVVSNTIGMTCAGIGLAPTQCRDVPGGLDLGSPLKGGLGAVDPTYGQPGAPYGIGNGFDGVPDLRFVQTIGPNNAKNEQYNGRLDFTPTAKDMFAFSSYFVPISQLSFNGPAREINRFNHDSLAQSWTAIYTRTISPTVINEARFGVSGWSWNEFDSNPQEPWGLPSATFQAIGQLQIQNLGAPGFSIFDQKTYNGRDTLSKMHGSHSLKFGADISRSTFLDTAPWSARPSYEFRNLWEFANDAAYQESANFDPVTGQPTAAQKNLRFNVLGFFVQDDWKVRPNLTLNLGLRWEYFSPLTETDGNLSNVVLGSGPATLTDLKIRKGGDLFHTSKNNWGPQVGFAWSPGTLQNRLVLRGGFGIGYNLEQLAITSNGRFNPPFLIGLTLRQPDIVYSLNSDIHSYTGWPSNPAAVQTFDPATGLPTSGAPIDLTGFPDNMPSTVTYRYSFDAQYDFGHNWMAMLGYQASQSRHYTIQNNLNLFYIGSTNPRVRSLSWYSNDANAHYNALLAQVQHRFSGSFEIDAQYRYSSNTDIGSQDYFMDFYPWNLAHARGPADFDVTHLLKLWGVYSPTLFRNAQGWVGKVVGGWSISGILNAHSGFPWTPKYSNTGGNVAYPNSGFNDLYPASYSGGAGSDYGNSTFMQSNGNFPKGALAYLTVPTWPAVGIPPEPAANVTRNMFRGPRFLGTDVQLAKDFGLPKMKVLGEGARLNLRANFYNIFNKLNLRDVNNVISNDGVTSNPQFGQAQHAFSGRIVELQARFSF
jgi:hypothetical protein